MTEHHAVGFAKACALLGRSVRTGKRQLAAGTFPVPEQPRQGHRRLFSTVHIEHWLTNAATEDVARNGHQRERS